MAETTNRGYPLPAITDTVAEEFYRLQQQTLVMLDIDVHALFEAINGLAPTTHTHTIGQVEGLTAALEGKMPIGATFKLDDLTDVDGADAAPDGYVLVKAGGLWIAQSAAAAIGDHDHQVADVLGLEDALQDITDELLVHDAAFADRVSFSTIQGKGNQEKGRARTNIDAGVMAGFRNKLINGNLDIWQRVGATSLIVPAGQSRYVADRWLIENATNQSVTIERYTASAADRDAIAPSVAYALKAVFSAAPTSGKLYFTQKIEDARTLSGETAVTATAHMTTNIAGLVDVDLDVYQVFGSGGSTTVTVRTGLAGAISGAWGKVQALFGMPSLTGKTVGAGSNLWATWSVTPRATGQVFFTHASLVEGDCTFEVDPYPARHVTEELTLCQRYYEKSYEIDTAVGTLGSSAGATWAYGATESAGGIGTPIEFSVRKRVVPTMTFYNQASGAAGTWQASANGSNIDASCGTGGIVGQRGSLAYCNTSFGQWVPAYIRGHWTADAEL